MSKIVKGNYVKGASNNYSITNYNMTKGVVVDTDTERDKIRVKVLEHEHGTGLDDDFWVEEKYFEPIIPEFKVGDIVRGITENYGITNTQMTKAKVVEIFPGKELIAIEVLEHERGINIGTVFTVGSKDFELIESKKFKVGDIVKGITDKYGITNTQMYKAEVIKAEYNVAYDKFQIVVKVLEHENKNVIGNTYKWLDSSDFELVQNGGDEEKVLKTKNDLQVGDYVTGTEEADEEYLKTTSDMIGVVSEINNENDIFVKIVEHKTQPTTIGSGFNVRADYFVKCTKSGLKVGDYIQGTKESDKKYAITNSRMRKAEITEILKGEGIGEHDITIKVLKHIDLDIKGMVLDVNSDYFERYKTEITEINVGDYIKGTERANPHYGITDENMLLAEVLEKEGDNILIKVLKHKDTSYEGVKYNVDSNCFDKVDKSEFEAALPKFKVGDYIKGTKEATRNYFVTSEKMTLGQVVRLIYDDPHIEVKILEHEDLSEIGRSYVVSPEFFVKALRVGDLLKATEEADIEYGVTNRSMKLGEVTRVYEDDEETEEGFDEDDIRIKVLDHTVNCEIGQSYDVESKYFEVVGKKDVIFPNLKVVKHGDDGLVYLLIDNKYTIAVPSNSEIGIAVKNEDDDFSETLGRAIAKARLKEAYKIKGGVA